MRTVKLVLSLALALSFVTITINEASAQGPRARARAREVTNTAPKTAAEASVYESNHNGNDQQSAQQRWNNATPNEKQTTENVAVSKYNKKQTNQADAKAAAQKRAATPRTPR